MRSTLNATKNSFSMALSFGRNVPLFGAVNKDFEYVGHLSVHVFLFRQARRAKDAAYDLMDYGCCLAYMVLFSSSQEVIYIGKCLDECTEVRGSVHCIPYFTPDHGCDPDPEAAG